MGSQSNRNHKSRINHPYGDASPVLNTTKQQSGWLILRSGVVYFAAVFAVGCVLGPIRVLWAVPRVGVRVAELMEMPLMLVVIILVVRWVVNRFEVPLDFWTRLGMGMIALGCLLIAEFGPVLWLQGLSIAEYVTTRDPIAGTVYYVMLCIFAVMPWLVAQGPKKVST